MKGQEDFLYLLIKSLSRSEKRTFRTFSQLLNKYRKSNYLSLFEIIEKLPNYNAKAINKQAAVLVDSKHINQLKKYLKEQIFISLRSSNKTSIPVITNIGFALSLKKRKLYKEAKKILKTQKNKAVKNEKFSMACIICEQLAQIEEADEDHSIESLGEMVDRYEELFELLEKEKYKIQLRIILTKVVYIIRSKERLVNEVQALRKILTEEIPKIDHNLLKSDSTQLYYYNLLSIIYFRLRDKKQAAFAIEKYYELSKKEMFQNNLPIRFAGLNNLLYICTQKNDQKRFFDLLKEFDQLIESNRTSPRMIYWRYLRLLDAYYYFDGLEPNTSFFRELDNVINDSKKRMNKVQKGDLSLSLAKYFFKEKKYTNARGKLIPVLVLDSISIEFPNYMAINILNILSLYELGLFDLVTKEIRSVKRKLIREDLIDEHFTELFKLLTQLNNVKKDAKKEKRILVKMNVFIDDQMSNENVLYHKDLEFFRNWVKNQLI